MYNLGLNGLSRNNLSNSLIRRDAGLFEKLFYQNLGRVIKEAENRKDRRFKFKNDIIPIDSTTISLCLSLFEWATIRSAKAGLKVCTMYDVKKQLPKFMVITEAERHDSGAVHAIPFNSQAIYVLNRGYLIYDILKKIHENGAFFVTRTSENTQYGIIRESKTTDPLILCNAEILFTGLHLDEYTGSLRLVRYKNPEDGKVYEFITNNMQLAATTIAAIY